jgi:vancomycin resistance protein YoaR
VKIGGGGICGAAGGINETIITNKAFEVTDRHNHSITYKSMYNNEIDGKQYWIPGLDAAVYTIPAGTKDFQFKNIREYPVVLVMNFDGKVGSTEE